MQKNQCTPQLTFPDRSENTLQGMDYNYGILMTEFPGGAPVAVSLDSQSVAQSSIQPVDQPRVPVQYHSSVQALGVNLLRQIKIINERK